MGKVLATVLIIIGLLVSFIAGNYTAIHRIVDVDKSSAGFQVYFANGTGHWYEY